MPNDPYTLIGLGVGAALLLWLVFSLIRKAFGLALLAALVLGGWLLWSNPEMLQSLLGSGAATFATR